MREQHLLWPCLALLAPGWLGGWLGCESPLDLCGISLMGSYGLGELGWRCLWYVWRCDWGVLRARCWREGVGGWGVALCGHGPLCGIGIPVLLVGEVGLVVVCGGV